MGPPRCPVAFLSQYRRDLASDYPIVRSLGPGKKGYIGLFAVSELYARTKILLTKRT